MDREDKTIRVSLSRQGVLTISGEATAITARSLQQQIRALCLDGEDTMTLDLSQLSKMDSVGAQIIFGLRRSMGFQRVSLIGWCETRKI